MDGRTDEPSTSWTVSDDRSLKLPKYGRRWTDGHMDESPSAEAWYNLTTGASNQYGTDKSSQ